MLHIYSTAPLDIDWEHLPTIKETILNYTNNDSDNMSELRDFIVLWMDVKLLIKRSGEIYEEIVYGPRVVWTFEGDFQLTPSFIFKIENGGNTYVISAIELLHLSEYKVDELV